MRAGPLAAAVLAALTLLGVGAAASPGSLETAGAGAVALVPGPSPFWALDALQGGASETEPTEVPQLTGPAHIVARAAALVGSREPVSADQLRLLAAEQHLVAAVEPVGPLAWRLGRFLPPVPPLPAASVALPSPVEGALSLPAPARAAVVAAGVAGLLSLALPRLPLLPLYSRIEREEAMLNARRSQLYELVRSEPGIHLSDLVRRSGLGWGAALYHLGVLEKNRVVVAHAEGGFKRYFANGMHPREDMTRLAALRHGAAKALFDAVKASPGRSGRELAETLGLSPSTLARASERLEEAGLLRRLRAGRRVLYFPAEPVQAAASPVAAAA